MLWKIRNSKHVRTNFLMTFPPFELFELWTFSNGPSHAYFDILHIHLVYLTQDTNKLEYLIPKKSSLRHRLPMGDQGFIDFVAYLLEINPKKRPSASEALKHPWLQYPYEPISSWRIWDSAVDHFCWKVCSWPVFQLEQLKTTIDSTVSIVYLFESLVEGSIRAQKRVMIGFNGDIPLAVCITRIFAFFMVLLVEGKFSLLL